MPLVPFESLGDDSRVWVFAADPRLDGERAADLLTVIDGFLSQWTAHGSAMTCGRDWRDGRFLAVGADQSATHASGCSIDGLYKKLGEFEKQNGVSLLSRDAVYFRDQDGEVQSASRDEFARLSSGGSIGAATSVFDTSVSSLREWRERFELPASGSWHRALLAV